ncbi:hypothetical protein C4553_02535 [Candidatus Parcubacteria bacterium]|nr:MAG: hypothetical protein C4553_02535 [Candidatus Parcubacteria bacterium]
MELLKIKKNIFKATLLGAIVFVTVLLSALFAPNFIFAQQTGIVPCGDYFDASGNLVKDPCTVCHTLVVVQRIINLLIGPPPGGIVYAIVIAMVAYGGFIYLTAGGSEGRVRKAKEVLSAALIGLLIGLGSYLIVNTVINVMSGLGSSTATAQPQGFPWPWNQVSCQVQQGGQLQPGVLTVPTSSTSTLPPGANTTCVRPVVVSLTTAQQVCNGPLQQFRTVQPYNTSRVNPYALPLVVSKLDQAYQIASATGSTFSLSEGCPPFVPHSDPGHCTGASVDIVVNNPTPQNIGKVCWALQQVGYRLGLPPNSSDIINEYSACNTPICTQYCGPSRRFNTTTGDNIHLSSPTGSGAPTSQVQVCQLTRIEMFPGGYQGSGFFTQSRPFPVLLVIVGNTNCAGQNMQVSLIQSNTNQVVPALNNSSFVWGTGYTSYTYDLFAGEDACVYNAFNPDCKYHVRVSSPALGTISTLNNNLYPRANISYECDQANRSSASASCDNGSRWQIRNITGN